MPFILPSRNTTRDMVQGMLQRWVTDVISMSVKTAKNKDCRGKLGPGWLNTLTCLINID